MIVFKIFRQIFMTYLEICNFIIWIINIIISPLYYGIGCLSQTVLLLIFLPSWLHFDAYESTSIIGFWVAGGAIVMGQMTWIYSTKFSAASKMAPIGYIKYSLKLNNVKIIILTYAKFKFKENKLVLFNGKV